MILRTSNDHHLRSELGCTPRKTVVPVFVFARSFTHGKRVNHSPVSQARHIHGLVNLHETICSDNRLIDK